MKTYTPILPRFRSRWASAIQVFAMLGMIMHPLSVNSSWSDTDADSINDMWTDPISGSTYNEEDLNLISSDIDGDNATNAEELQHGSNPFSFDTDGDGLDDGTEIHLAIVLQGKNYSLTLWDSNGDAVSDYDDFYSFHYVTYPGGQLPSFSGASYSDYDGDGIKNPEDLYPADPINNDADNDGIDDVYDPNPADASNFSTTNNTYWGSNALGDADGDYNLNFWDETPNVQTLDSDSDGFVDDIDPAPSDSTNYSTINYITWYGSARGDDDGDGVINFDDYQPYASTDTDGDGYADDTDPAPSDSNNYSSINYITWFGTARSDDDGDGVINFDDYQPYSPTDTDGDGYADNIDPAPSDSSNYSSTNFITWYGFARGDDDEDGTLNFHDYQPYTSTDTDGDGYADDTDPAPSDSSNYSSINYITWHGTACDDDDGDGTINFDDYQPYPPTDTDGDGYTDDIDPAPEDATNTSPYNAYAWYSDALGDHEYDGILNFFDENPWWWPPPPLDNDEDGLKEYEEMNWGTSDSDPDSDDDGLTDYEEVYIYGTVPTNMYHLSQNNGWGSIYTDYELVNLTDTDSDTIPDRVEQHYASYGLRVDDATDSWRDIDANGINNRTQYAMGIALDADMSHYDQDMDGMSDVFEDYYSLDKELEADAVADNDADGVTNFEEMKLVLSPQSLDSYGNGSPIGDLLELMISIRYPNPNTAPPTEDTNGNGIPDWADSILTTPAAPDFAHFTRLTPGDLDGDSLPDEWEHRYGRRKYTNGVQLRTADAMEDNDTDSLTNAWEYILGTSPVAGDSNSNGVNDGDEDSDGDGIPDWWEALHDLNPQSATDAEADEDGDGISNLDEFTFQLDPRYDDFTAKAAVNVYDLVNRLTSTQQAGGAVTAYTYDPEGNLLTQP